VAPERQQQEWGWEQQRRRTQEWLRDKERQEQLWQEQRRQQRRRQQWEWQQERQQRLQRRQWAQRQWEERRQWERSSRAPSRGGWRADTGYYSAPEDWVGYPEGPLPQEWRGSGARL